MNPTLSSVRQAFDRHASTYDKQFSHRPIGETIRSEVWAIAEATFSNARRILDLGCGTGEDAVHFAATGIHVTGVDISSEMLSRAAAKSAGSNLSARTDWVNSAMESYRPTQPFDAIFSNFGALNCAADLRWLRDVAIHSLKPGSSLIFTTMGSFYPLEAAVFLLRLQPGKAFRRLRDQVQIHVEGIHLPVFYHSPRAMKRMLGSEFHLQRIIGLRALLPVPGWEHIDRFSSLRYLRSLDRALCRWRPTACWADHFVSVWRFEP